MFSSEFLRTTIVLQNYAVATQRHLLVATFHTNPTSNRLVDTVVVGSATVDASNEAPHVIAIAVVPVTEIHSFWPFVGVPVKFVVNDVIATDWLVITIISKLSVFNDGVAVFAVEAETLGVTRLLVNVCVSVVPTIPPLTEEYDVPQAEPVDSGIPAPG